MNFSWPVKPKASFGALISRLFVLVSCVCARVCVCVCGASVLRQRCLFPINDLLYSSHWSHAVLRCKKCYAYFSVFNHRFRCALASLALKLYYHTALQDEAHSETQWSIIVNGLMG